MQGRRNWGGWGGYSPPNISLTKGQNFADFSKFQNPRYHNLRAQLQTFKSIFRKKDNLVFGDIIEFFKRCAPQVLSLLSELCKIIELILVLPASNAESERSFSKMKLIKGRLRSTMKTDKLNHFMIVGLNKDIFDNLDFEEVVDEFISRNERRQKLLGK